ncbi:MAG: T9SS type A sorting domain-containing protein [Bacteroidota bacterium]|nr:T9SS type A sorting domain-containing protein [Bacteroidota bacterium]
MLLDDIKVEVGDNVSTDNFVKSTFSVYPNPASDLINITSSESNIAKITISDINGRVVKSFDFNNVSETSLNISDLANGVYMLNFDNDGVISTKKFIKK